jgi:hypothetical protein
VIKTTYLPTYLPIFLTWKSGQGETRGHSLASAARAAARRAPAVMAAAGAAAVGAATCGASPGAASAGGDDERRDGGEQLVGHGGLWNPPKASPGAAGLAEATYLP